MTEFLVRFTLATKANGTNPGTLVQAIRRLDQTISVEGDRICPSAEMLRLLERVERGEYV